MYFFITFTKLSLIAFFFLIYKALGQAIYARLNGCESRKTTIQRHDSHKADVSKSTKIQKIKDDAQ
jgi:hypothetical protein